MKNVEQIVLLYDFYGLLLTDRQRELIQAYHLEDLSLAEIAEHDGVSRQAVHDLIKRSETVLRDYEARLGLVREYQERQERLSQLAEALEQADLATARSIVQVLRDE